MAHFVAYQYKPALGNSSVKSGYQRQKQKSTLQRNIAPVGVDYIENRREKIAVKRPSLPRWLADRGGQREASWGQQKDKEELLDSDSTDDIRSNSGVEKPPQLHSSPLRYFACTSYISTRNQLPNAEMASDDAAALAIVNPRFDFGRTTMFPEACTWSSTWLSKKSDSLAV